MTAQRLIRIAAAFLVSVVLATVAACVIGTQFVLAALTGIGVDIPLSDRLATTWYDIVNFGFVPSPSFGFSYALVIGIGLFIAFLAAAALSYFLPQFRRMIYTVAGGAAIVTFLGASFFVFSVVLFAFAQTPMGLISQALAGALGGWIFATLTTQETTS